MKQRIISVRYSEDEYVSLVEEYGEKKLSSKIRELSLGLVPKNSQEPSVDTQAIDGVVLVNMLKNLDEDECIPYLRKLAGGSLDGRVLANVFMQIIGKKNNPYIGWTVTAIELHVPTGYMGIELQQGGRKEVVTKGSPYYKFFFDGKDEFYTVGEEVVALEGIE